MESWREKEKGETLEVEDIKGDLEIRSEGRYREKLT